MTKGMVLGILKVAEGDDVAFEEEVIFDSLKEFPTAVALLMGLLYALNIDYTKGLLYTFEMIQKVVMDIGGSQCSALVHGLRNKHEEENVSLKPCFKLFALILTFAELLYI